MARTGNPTGDPTADLRNEAARRQRLVGPRTEDAMALFDAIVGVYGSAPAFTLSTVARCATSAAELATLAADRQIVKLRCMRGSVYAVPAKAYPVVYAATKEQVTKGRERGLKWAGVEDKELKRLTAKLREVRAGQPPATVAELRAGLGKLSAEAEKNFSIVASSWASQGILVRAGVPGTSWRDDTVTYALTSDWLPDADLGLDVATARAELARMYLRAFGPATTADFAWWSGLGKREARAAVGAVLGDAPPPDGEPVRVDDAPAAGAGKGKRRAGDGVRLLPAWDTYLVGYQDRSRQAAAEHLPWLYDKMGNATSTVVFDGRVVGVWQLHATEPVAVHVAWLPDVAVPDLDAVAAEAARLASLLGLGAEPAVAVVDLPPPLPDRPKNAHLTPLPRPK